MVDCAREMLELTVLLWVQRDRFVESHHDYDWMLMCWGIPSSGVLCVELLKQIKGVKKGGAKELRLPRSEIVQNLSLLIGFLEWVKPAAGNYQLCGRMRIIIKRILDQILNPGMSSSSSSDLATGAAMENGVVLGGEGDVNSTGANAEMVGGGNRHAHGGVFQQQQQQQYDPAMFEQQGAGIYGDIGDAADNFDWLNNVDWSRGPWR